MHAPSPGSHCVCVCYVCVHALLAACSISASCSLDVVVVVRVSGSGFRARIVVHNGLDVSVRGYGGSARAMTDGKRKRDEHLAGGRPWLWVFESLRAAAQPATLAPTLLQFSTPTILHCCCYLPPSQVAADVAFLVRAVSEKYLPVDGAESARVCRLASVFARGVFQRVQLEFTAETELTLLQFFRGLLTSTAIEPEAGKAKVEAVAALGHFLKQLHEGARLLSVDVVADRILFLVRLIEDPAAARSNFDWELEVHRLTFVALGYLFSQARPLVAERPWTIALQALRVILESFAALKSVVENYASARYFVDLVRCLYIMISDSEWCLEEHEGAIVEGLQVFVSYGSSESDFEGELVLTDIVSTFSFDTDEKPSDEDHAYRQRSAELRLLSISTIQVMARGSHSKGIDEMVE